MLYFLIQRGHENLRQIFKIAAYISVFYEKRPSKTIKVGDNFSWEIVAHEIHAKYANDKKNTYNMNCEYIVLMLISILGISLFTTICLKNSNFKECFELILSSTCSLYFFISLFLFYKTIKGSSSKNSAGIKIQHLKDFLQYSLDTGHYTKEEIKERFGDFLQEIENFET
jgi:hypothetical protein